MELKFKGSVYYDERLQRKRRNFIAIKAYGRKLKAEGWTYSVSSGGYISPDRSAIYYTSRSPYEGRVMKNSCNGDYRSTIAALWKTGHFKAYLSEMEIRQLNACKTRATNFIGTVASTIPFVFVLFLMVTLS